MTTDVETIVMRPELDEYKDAAISNAERGVCEGSCEEHRGDIHCVRVYDKEHGIDWGWFSYCEEAVAEDTRRGMVFIDA